MRVIRLTSEPVSVTAATKQDLRLACDVLEFDELDLIVTVHQGSSLIVKITTAMSIDDNLLGWVDAATAFSALSTGASEKKNIPNPLRYIRWETTAAVAGTFSITGIGRRWA